MEPAHALEETLKELMQVQSQLWNVVGHLKDIAGQVDAIIPNAAGKADIDRSVDTDALRGPVIYDKAPPVTPDAIRGEGEPARPAQTDLGW